MERIETLAYKDMDKMNLPEIPGLTKHIKQSSEKKLRQLVRNPGLRKSVPPKTQRIIKKKFGLEKSNADILSESLSMSPGNKVQEKYQQLMKTLDHQEKELDSEQQIKWKKVQAASYHIADYNHIKDDGKSDKASPGITRVDTLNKLKTPLKRKETTTQIVRRLSNVGKLSNILKVIELEKKRMEQEKKRNEKLQNLREIEEEKFQIEATFVEAYPQGNIPEKDVRLLFAMNMGPDSEDFRIGCEVTGQIMDKVMNTDYYAQLIEVDNLHIDLNSSVETDSVSLNSSQ